MFINKALPNKKTEKLKKKSKSKNKIKKPSHKEKEPRNNNQPHHQNSTYSLIPHHNASQCSLISEHHPKKSSTKLLKSHQQSCHHLPTKSQGKRNNNKQKKSTYHKNPKKTSPNTKIRKQHRDEIYERIALGEYNSITNSEINFSSNTSSRIYNKNKKNLTIECSDDYILNQYITNSLSHYGEYRRNDAAIKIQKVFRGYLTRKMLQNFIEKQEARLYQLSERLKENKQKQMFSKKSSPIKIAKKQKVSLINYSADLLFQQQINNITSTPINSKINHGSLQQESSIKPEYNDSLSKYLPQDSPSNQIYDDPTTMMNNKQIFEGDYSQTYLNLKQPSINTNLNGPSTNKIEQPLATDFSQVKVPQFPTIYNQQQKLSAQRSVQQKKQSPQKTPKLQNIPFKNRQKQQVKLLKKQQKQKWNKIIEMFNEQILLSTEKQRDIHKSITNILQFSKKNKQELQKNEYSCKKIVQIREQIEQQLCEQNGKQIQNKQPNQIIDILKEQSNNVNKIRKNQDMPLIIRKNLKESSPCNLLERTQELKKYFRKNLTTYPIEQMIEIREKALQKREKQMVNKLNEDLQKSSISHQRFLQRLGEMQLKFESQKEIINKTKLQIFMGNQAVNKLVQDSFLDARYLGFNIPFSQSMKDIKKTNNLWIKDIIVDQLKSFNKTSLKNTINQENQIQQRQEESHLTLKQSQSQSIEYLNEAGEEDISYNEGAVQKTHYKLDGFRNFEESFQSSEEQDSEALETASKFRRINPISTVLYQQRSPLFQKPSDQLQKQIVQKITINRQKNTDLSIFEELRKYDPTSRRPVLENPKKEVFNLSFQQSQDSQDQMIFDQKIDPTINQITQDQITQLMWEVVGQIFQNSSMWRKFHRPHHIVQQKITQEQRNKFVNLLFEQLSVGEQIIQRLNQKMVPSRLQLLKYMRVSLEEDTEQEQQQEQQSEYSQIGKYELIFPPELCIQTIQIKMSEQVLQQNSTLKQNQIEEIKNVLSDKVSTRCIERVIQRQNFRKFSESQRKDLRIQINKIEYHCIFDAINQTILKIHSRTVGYSGIGLNQISGLFLADQQNNHKIKSSNQVDQLLQATKNQVSELITDNKSSNQKIMNQNYDDLCKNDSLWIQYSDQALSFAMQLVYMLQDEFFMLQSDQIMKTMLKKNLFMDYL